ncbi:hypothetical protein JCM11251_000178 [Rhodosporidiobolus azoricus]
MIKQPEAEQHNPEQSNLIHPDIAALAQRWQDGSDNQDDLVAELLRMQLRLKDEIRQKETALRAQAAASEERQAKLAATAQAEAQAREEAALRKDIEDLDRKQNEADEELQMALSQFQAVSSRKEEVADQQEFLDARLADLNSKMADLTMYGATGSIKAWGKGKAQALVLINGNLSPFSDKLIQRGLEGGKKASMLLREAIADDMDSASYVESYLSTAQGPDVSALLPQFKTPSSPTPTFSSGSVIIRRANLLVSDEVISAPSTFHQFMEGFGLRSEANYVCEAERNRAETHLAALLKTHGFAEAVQRIYLVGVHPLVLMSEISALEDSYGGLKEVEKGVLPKVVLVKHLEDADFAEKVGGPTVDFASLFDSSVARSLDGKRRQPPPSEPVARLDTAPRLAARHSQVAHSAPALIKPDDGDWQIVSGNSAGRKANASGSTHVPAIVPWANMPASNANDKSTTKRDQAASPGKGKEKEVVVGEQAGRKISPPGRRINASRGMLQQDAMSDGQLNRLREDVGKSACPNLRKYKTCTYTSSNNEIDPKVIARAIA